MIDIRDLAFSYPRKGAKVFDGLNISLKGDAVYGLLGKNGMGKSTLLYLICGLLRPKSGSVMVDGMESKERMQQMLEQMFIVTEDFELPSMRLHEYVKANCVFYPNFSMDVLNSCLKEFEMEGDPQLNALSMGQKKKVYMSFALATGTKYLIMEEPTNGLDIPSKAQFRKVLAQGVDGERTVIISTHQVHDVENLLDHVIILDHSKVMMNASVSDICNKYVFEYRSADDMADAIHAEPSLQGSAVMAPRGDKPETMLNLELLFNAATQGKLNSKTN